MTREEAKPYIGELQMYAKSRGWDEEYLIACDIALNVLEQEPMLDKVRAQIEDLLKGLGVVLAILEKGDKLEPKLKGAIEAVEECINIIDKVESEET